MMPIAYSPIVQLDPVVVVDGWQVSKRRSMAALRLADVTPLSKVLVKSDANSSFTAGHRTRFGTAQALDDDVLEVGCDPGAWLLIGPVGCLQKIIDAAKADVAMQTEHVTVIDITHGRALMRLTGTDATNLLSKICAIDLRDSVSPNLHAFRSSVAKLITDVIRDDLADGTRSYLLHCERSSGQHLFDCVLDAGTEFGIDVDGWS